MRSVEHFKMMNRYEASFVDGISMRNKWKSFIYRYTANNRLHAVMRDDVLSVRVKSKRCEKQRMWRYKTGSYYVSFD